jgi:hypothetical protein
VSAVALPPLLIAAGCCLREVGRQVVVLDQDGHELARGPKKQTDWLWTASIAALIERRAAALGLSCELHSQELLFRLWRSAADQGAAPWLSFDDALVWLASEETARHRQRGCPEPITACSEQEATERWPRERRRGRAIPVAAHRLDEPMQRAEVAPAEPITSTQEPQSAGKSVIEHRRPGPALDRVAPVATLALDELERPGWMASCEPITSIQELHSTGRGVIEHQGRGRPDRGMAVAGQATSRPEQRGQAAPAEPITSRLELQSPGHGVIVYWRGAGSSPGQAALAASRAVWARDGPVRGRGAMRSESITPAREPSRTKPTLLGQRVMHLRCGRWP